MRPLRSDCLPDAPSFAYRVLDEESVQGGVERNSLGGARELAGDRIALEDSDVRRVLIAADEPLGCGVKGEVARGLSAARDSLDECKIAVFAADREDYERIFAAIARVQEVAVR